MVGASGGSRRPNDHAADRFEHLTSGVRLAEIARAPRRARLLARVGIVMGCNEEDRRRDPLDVQLLLQLEPGHPEQLHIEHQAVELGMLRIRKKSLGRRIGGRLHARSAQQSRQ